MATADAQFAIDIATAMPEGEQTIAQLDKLTAELMGSGKGAEHFQQAIAQTADALTAAKAASVAANTTLADAQDEYRKLERAALQASKAAERAAAKNGGIAPPDLQRRVEETAMALDHSAHALAHFERAAGDASTAQDEFTRKLANLRKLSAHVDKSYGDQANALGKLQSSINTVGGPLGRLGTQVIAPAKGFSELSAVMGKSKAAALLAVVGIAAVAAAVVALTAAVTAGVIALAAYGVRLADTARSAGLASDALVAVHPEIAGVRDGFEALTDQTGITGDKLTKLSRDLLGAKVSAEQLPAALRAAALAEAALGEGGAAQFIAELKEGKTTVDEFATNAERKFGGIVARQMLGLDAQMARFKRNVSELFGGLDIDPALEGLRTLVALFDKSEASGAAIKLLFETIFQPLIDQARNAAYAVEAFALGFLIGLTEMYIAAKPAIKWVKELFGFDDTSLEDVLGGATKAGEIFAKAFMVVAGVFAVATAAVLAVVGVIIALQVAVWATIASIVAFGAKVVSAFVAPLLEAWDKAKGLDFLSLGKEMMIGLAKGIAGAAGAVVDSITGAVGGAVKAAKKMLGIASPSKLFMGFGEDTGEGYVRGVDAMADDVGDAMRDMVAPPADVATPLEAFGGSGAAATPAPSGGAPAPAAPAGPSVVFQAPVNFYGVKDAEHATDLFEDMLTRVLEGDASAVGGAT